jgi:hypothetical protein
LKSFRVSGFYNFRSHARPEGRVTQQSMFPLQVPYLLFAIASLRV